MLKFSKISFSMTLCAISFVYCKGNTLSANEILYNTITSSYVKQARPAADPSQPVQVSLGFTLSTINEYVEKDSRLSITGTFLIKWNDYRITWDPVSNANITSIMMDVKEVWVPPLQIANSYYSFSVIGQNWMKLRYMYNGYAMWYATDNFEVKCTADITYYPYDKHNCYLTLTTQGYLKSEMNMSSDSNTIVTQFYYQNTLWELDNDTARSLLVTNAYGQYFNAFFSFKRRPAFYIANLVVPTSLIGLLNVLVFLLPATSGERVGFSVTILLAMSVFQTIVSDSLPTSAIPNIPKLCYFLLADLVIQVVITISTIIVLRVYDKDDKDRIPAWLSKLISLCFCRKMNIKVDDKCVQPKLSWKDVGQVFDVMLFFFFAVVILAKDIALIITLQREPPTFDVNDYFT